MINAYWAVQCLRILSCFPFSYLPHLSSFLIICQPPPPITYWWMTKYINIPDNIVSIPLQAGVEWKRRAGWKKGRHILILHFQCFKPKPTESGHFECWGGNNWPPSQVLPTLYKRENKWFKTSNPSQRDNIIAPLSNWFMRFAFWPPSLRKGKTWFGLKNWGLNNYT